MRTLSARLVAIELVFLLVALLSIGLTLYLSWTLEGSAAAINDAGSLRMRAYHVAALVRDADRDHAAWEAVQLDMVLERLRAGDPARPLALPNTAGVREQLDVLESAWADLKPRLIDHETTVALAEIDGFVLTVDEFVKRIEQANATSTELLRGAQLGLLALAIIGTVALIYLSFMFVIRPIARLSEGIARMRHGELSVRVPVESRDEFGALTQGFNDMAEALQESYRTLEARVLEKTRDLARQNQQLAMLYDMTAFLSTALTVDDLCRGFVARVVRAYDAVGGTVRLRNTHDGSVHIIASDGVSQDFLAGERCLPDDACACGAAIQQTRSVIHLVRKADARFDLPYCRNERFESVVAVPIDFRHNAIGVFNLFFASPRELAPDERHLLETLGQHLGVAIENLRLIAREREVAVFEERNHLAQQLHDSIAQSLAFLNLQTQMLDDALKQQDPARSTKHLAEIKTGVQECYADVRELLTHFRTRVGDESLEEALHSIFARFERQTGIPVAFSSSGNAHALSPDHELQLIHIAQEALSNIRKHSACTRVEVSLRRGPAYELRVRDDGCGFDPQASRREEHVGLRIMQERSERVGGTLEVRSQPGAGTEILLRVPLAQPQPA
ncbi:MAG TPA: type IV pili methyl-accepting chemotaxis transducer N-terminal domain-containing protein [Burkholderiales bacterium]|nr:type IV pili methyl-accepting chemotaxis transducer N-terminal domain-containing protein [Burkholderiales bacterium]